MLDRKMTFVSGKGGVGKSAVTASLAIAAARRGLRVLVIGMVESIGVAAHLATEPLSYRPRQVRPGLHALAVNRSEALDEYLRLQLRVPKAAPTRVLTRALSVLAETAPGVREVVTIGKPVYEMWRGSYDLVLVDAPPLGQLLSYLRAPATIADMVPAGLVRAQAERISAALRDPALVDLLLVTTPEELPMLETQAVLRQLEADPLIELVAVVANRVLPALELSAAAVESLPEGSYRAAARHQLAAQERQQRWLGELPDGPRFPYLFGIHTAGEVSEKLADLWDGQL
jgi:anion-transporting  ArsA/GET3 family ATPase